MKKHNIKKNILDCEFHNYLIVSHLSNFDRMIKYNLSSKYNGMYNLSEQLSITDNYNNEEYKIKILSYTYNPSKIDEPKSEIILSGYGSISFSGIINFHPENNNFIYDFSFDICKDKEKDIEPPKALTLSKNQQFNIYMKLLRDMNNEKLLLSLLDNSFYYLKEDNYYNLDFYLSLFCNANNKIIELLSYFNLNKVKLIENIEKTKFSKILNKIKIQPNLITNYLNGDNKEIDKILELFYSLLLYYRINYERDNINELFEDKNANKYYINILLSDYKHFNNIPPLPNSFINEMLFSLKELDNQKMIIILKYLQKPDNILTFLNEHSDIIYEIKNGKKENKINDNEEDKEENGNEDEQENNDEEEDDEEQEEDEEKKEEIKNKNDKKKIQKINLMDIMKISKNDNMTAISNEINKLIKNDKIIQYIDIGENFWKIYSDKFNKKDLDKLISIKKIILNIKKKNETLIDNIDFIYYYIHETGLDMSINHKFTNEELLKFIKEEDIYYNLDKYKLSRDVRIFSGLQLLKIKEDEEKFYSLWNSINFTQIFDQQQINDIQKLIISNAKDIQSFHILFKLFDYSNDKIFNEDTILLLRNQYISNIQNFDENKNEKINDIFLDDSILLIYLLDKINSGKNFVKNDFINKLSLSFVNKIFLNLIEKYVLSEDLFLEIIDFFTLNENLKLENFILIINKLTNIKCMESLLGKIDKYIIKKENILNHIDTDEFKLLKEFKRINIFNNKNFEYTSYILNTNMISKEIFDDLNNNNISYNDLNKAKFINFKNELENKLEVLNINNYVQDIKNLVNKLYKYKIDIENKIEFLDKCIYVNKNFFNISKQREIEELEILLIKITKGNLNELDKNKNKFDEYENMFTEEYLEDKISLSNSLFFTSIFKHLTKKNENDEGAHNTFEEAVKNYKCLIKLFDGVQNSQINKEILDICLKSVKGNEKWIASEIYLLKQYFNIKESKKYNFENIINNLIIYLKKKNIIHIINGILFFLNKTNAILTEYSEKLKNIINDLSSNNLDFIIINNNLKYLEKEELIIINDKENEKIDYLDIFIDFYVKRNAFYFLLSFNEEDFRHLHEVINLSDNTFLSSSDIEDMMKCKQFLDNVKGTKPITDKKIINIFIKNIKKEKKIYIYFKSYFNNYSQIKELKTELFNKSESNKTKIKKVSNYSIFYLSIDAININEITKKNGINNTYIYFDGSYKNNLENENVKNKNRNISFDELLELRDSSMLDKKLGNEKEKELFAFYKQFSQNIKHIINIFDLLDEIAKKGYPENISIEINIINNESIYKLNNINIEYHKCMIFLNEILENTTRIQQITYENNNTELIRFIYGRQFNFINTCLKEKHLEYTWPLLNYITNNMYKLKLEEYNYQNITENNIENHNENKNNVNFNNVIFNCNNYFLEVLDKNKLTVKDIYSQNIINKQYNFKGLYYYNCFESDLEEQILNFYILLTNNFPMAQTLLICNKETSLEELISFSYRAVLCQFNVFFVLGKIEELPPEKCEILLELLMKLNMNKEKTTINSCLLFLYSNNNSEFVRHIQKLNYCKMFKHENKKKNLDEGIFDLDGVEIIYSDNSGVGKSTKIKNEIKELKKNYIYFPLGGDFNKIEIIQRLKKINFSFKNENKIVLHIDLFDTEKTDLMKEFLFSILITKLYGQNEDIFYLNKEIEIKIELPCGFIDFFLKFPFLKLFKNKTKISIKELPELIVSKDINSDMQIICNYLRLFKNKKIISNDLYIKNISPEKYNEFPNKIVAEVISKDECKELIYEYLNIEFPNYYQINNFIKILSGQFKKFTLVSSLSANNLNNLSEKMGNADLINSRYLIIDILIKNTLFFIESSFQQLLNSQNITHNVCNLVGEYDEKKLNKLAVETLSKENEIISYYNIKSPLIFFHEGINPDFSIISPYLPDNEEYKKLVYLQNILSICEKIPKNINKKELFTELKKIDLYNPNNKITINIEFINNLISQKIVKDSLNKYEEYKPESFFKIIKQILNLSNPINKKDKNVNNSNYTISEIVGYYVFTADNFLKMLLILIKIRENIPVVMMGETGCGKTSLIRKLYQLMNNGEDNMKILNIHSGITNKEINDFIFEKTKANNNKSIIEEALELNVEEEKKKLEYLDKKKIYNPKKLWVFLDEINTCNCMGLISELICKHSCNGIPLPDNIVIIGACNPYRLSKINSMDGLHFKNEIINPSSNLVYTVNPLPHSLLNYVINFGSLSPEDEKKYIINIIKEPIENYYLQALEKNNAEDINSFSFFTFFENIFGFNQKTKIIKRKYDINDLSERKKKECINLTNIASKSIIFAQNFIRNIIDISSVSLREIRRFSVFYDYFVKYLFKKKEIESMNNLKEYNIFKYSVILSIYICYYFHIKKRENRKEFCTKMNEFLESFKLNFLDIPKQEIKYIIDNITLPQGIAKNEALVNNLFTLFVCVTSKIPLFIIGKPGCSKSLSVQLLFKAMKGENSNNKLFKNYPKLICNSYQGSLTSTSKGVQKIFDKARNLLRNLNKNELDKIISMIYFDEMGLAEHSPNNPLKVLHSNLEYDLNEDRKKIAFVGISNWKLDAAKMNRGIYLSISEPDEEDLKKTAITIANSYNKKITNKNIDLYNNIATTYFKYKNELNNYIDKKEFHGSRDFYYLVKIIAKNLNKYTKENIEKNVLQNIALNGIERNLAGLKFDDYHETTSLEKVKKIFQEKYNNCEVNNKYNVIEKIQENIHSLNNRYLLLIANSSISEYLIKYFLIKEKSKNDINDNNINYSNDKLDLNSKFQDIIFYIGSKFIQDKNSEEYTLKILNKIQLQIEKNTIIIMKDLESIYPSLYDLFNQNFTIVSEKNYARLSVGYTNNTFSLVNDWLKCIVLVNENNIKKQDPPFLNRFEKHIINFEYLLRENEIDISKDILRIINSLKELKILNNKKITYDIDKLLINCHKEEIQGIIYYLSRLNKSAEDINDYILKKISFLLPQDIILLMHYSDKKNKYQKEYKKIIKYYNEEDHSNIINFLKLINQNKNIIYTFSNILDPISFKFEDNNNYIETMMYGKIFNENIKIVLINSIKSENELERIIDNFYSNEKEKIIIFKFNTDEIEYINYMKYFIEDKEKNDLYNNNKKTFIFIIYIKRIFYQEINPNIKNKNKDWKEVITHLSEYYQIFIDNLNGIDKNITKLIGQKCNNNLISMCSIDVDKLFLKNLYIIFSFFRYNFNCQIKDIDINKNNYSKYIIEYLNKDNNLRNKIILEILNFDNINKDEDIIKYILLNYSINQNNIDYISFIIDYLKEIIFQNLQQFIFKSEVKHFLSPLLSHFTKIKSKESNSILNNRFILYTIEYYFEDIKNDNKLKFLDKIGANNMTILLGIQIPGIKNVIEDLIQYINDTQINDLKLSINYLERENDIRYEYNDNNDDEYLKKIEKINKTLNKIEMFFFNYFKLNPLIKKIIEVLDKIENNNIPKVNDKNQENKILNYKEEIKEYFDLFLEDYFLIFLSNNFDLSNLKIYNRNMINEFIQIIKSILDYRFNDFSDYMAPIEIIKKISKYIIWIESNSKYIIKILIIYQKLSFIQFLNNKIKKIINNKEIKYEYGTKRSPLKTKLVNECFFLILESLIRTILNENNLYNKIINIFESIDNFLISMKEIYHYGYQLDFELNLFSKELEKLKSFIDILEIFHELNLDNENNIQILIHLLIEINKYNYINNNYKKEEIKEIFDCINNLYKFLLSNIGFHKKFSKLINNIFIGEIKKIKDNNYRKSILEIILNNTNIAKDSIQVFIIIFYDILGNNSVESIKNSEKKITENNLCFEIINKGLKKDSDNIKILEQVLLNLFESYFYVFFDTIKDLDKSELKEYYKEYYESKKNGENNITLTMVDFSLDTLKKQLTILEEIYKNINNNITNNNIIKLYSIAYIKVYLYKTINFILTKTEKFFLKDDVINIINGEIINDFRNVIKIYILKILNSSLNSYQELQNFHFKDYGFTFVEQFKEKLLEKNNDLLNYYILPSDKSFTRYMECLECFKSAYEEKFCGKTELFEKYINENNIDIFYSNAVNKIISNIDANDLIYTKFGTFSKNLLNNNNNISDYFKKLIFLFLDEDKFNSIIRPKILLKKDENHVKINFNIHEIIIYSMRFCLQTIYNKKSKNLYSQLINEKCTENINKYCLPGIDEPDNLKISNYYLLEKHFKNKTSDFGAYICSCGTYYEIPPCGFPIESYTCINCKQLIGGEKKKEEEKGYHKMIIREGHLRIFKNIEEKKIEFDRFKDNDNLIPNMIISDYKKKVIDPLLKNINFGIPKINKINFIQKNKKIRNLSQVGYRLLNFILYSHLFFSHCLGYIKDEYNSLYLCENMNYIEILKTNWELLKEALFSKGITIIQIFLNLIFEKISNLLKNCKEINNNEQRNIFEDSIEKMLEENYKEYEKYSKIYLELNMKLHNTNIENLKSIILELYSPDKYQINKYPFLEYFIMTKYPSEEDFINELHKIHNYENIYPLITSYTNPDNHNIKLLKYLPKYNKFVNFMINKYSYKISRNEAYKKKLVDEDIYKNNENNFKEILEDFFNVWNKIKKYCIQYKCQQMEEEILHENMPLSHFLIDDGEIGKGMYLASGYEFFIKLQNNFLEPIVNALDTNKSGILNYFNSNIKNRIDVQKTSKNEIISKDFPDNSLYINNLHLIFLNCTRNIFFFKNKKTNQIDNTKINYFNYNSFIYDFNSIEEELGKILLTGKKLFNKENIKFVTYCYEGFRGEKSSTLIDFTDLYKPKQLSDEEKQQLYDYVNDKNKYNKYEFTQIMFPIQFIIYYLTQETKEKNTTINNIIKDAPEYLNISNECKSFFEKFSKITVEQLYEVFSFIELLCYDSICKNLKDDYKIELDMELQEKISNYFSDGVQKIIGKTNLANACRKLISRYLISTRNDNDINPDNLLSLYLNKNELWNADFLNDKKDLFEMELNNIKSFNIKVKHAYQLCLFLDPENILLKNVLQKIPKIKKKNKKVKNNNNDSDDEKKPRRRIKKGY